MHLAQESCSAVAKTYMVAELLACSPELFLVARYSPSSSMAAPGMSPGEEFAKLGMLNYEPIEINVGETIIRVSIAGAVGLMGATALGEAKVAIAQKLTETFGKYQNNTEDSFTENSDINEIQQNDLDGTPDAQEHIMFHDYDEDDVATSSETHERAKFEALAINSAARMTETERRQKKILVEEMLEAQRDEYQKYIRELLDEQQIKQKEELHAVEENWRRQGLEAETTIRQKDIEIVVTQQKDINTTAVNQNDPWHGKSPGPDVMQKTAAAPPKQTPMIAQMEAPDKEWSAEHNIGPARPLGNPVLWSCK